MFRIYEDTKERIISSVVGQRLPDYYKTIEERTHLVPSENLREAMDELTTILEFRTTKGVDSTLSLKNRLELTLLQAGPGLLVTNWTSLYKITYDPEN